MKSLRKAANFHQFRNLKRLQFLFLDHITKADIDLLMNDENPPKEMIELFRCKFLEDEDVEQWKRVTHVKKWDVAFEFEKNL